MARSGKFPHPTRLLLVLAALVPGAAMAADVETYGTTLARYWSQEYPNLTKDRYVPLTQYVGIDARGLGGSGWSLHLFGWGTHDFAEASSPSGKGGGDLTYAYLHYRAPKANAELKAGRFAAQGAAGLELVDGLSARADLRGGFTVSLFGGKPVDYTHPDAALVQKRDFLGGGRLAWRGGRWLELGVSYLQDGKAPDPKLTPALEDRSRKLLGYDLRLSPHATLDLTGKVTMNRKEEPAGAPKEGSRIAAQDHTFGWRPTPEIQLSGSFTERRFKDFYAGTALPNLFRQVELEKYKAQGAMLAFGINGPFQFSADYRKAKREGYGDTNRSGAEIRGHAERLKLRTGFAYHRVTAADLPGSTGTVPFYSLSHRETRLWLLHDGGKYYLSLDGVAFQFDDKQAPMLQGEPRATLAVASLGFRPRPSFSFSGDVSYGVNPQYKKEVRGLLRLEFRFGGAQ